jgi:hypothetical protein
VWGSNKHIYHLEVRRGIVPHFPVVGGDLSSYYFNTFQIKKREGHVVIIYATSTIMIKKIG